MLHTVKFHVKPTIRATCIMSPCRPLGSFLHSVVRLLVMGLASLLISAQAADKPVLFYSQWLNAPGENRYPAEGVYSQAMDALRQEFNVRTNAGPLNARTLEIGRAHV